MNQKLLFGKNIPFDLEVEQSNKHLKKGIRNLGINGTENAVTRIAKAEKGVRKLLMKWMQIFIVQYVLVDVVVIPQQQI